MIAASVILFFGGVLAYDAYVDLRVARLRDLIEVLEGDIVRLEPGVDCRTEDVHLVCELRYGDVVKVEEVFQELQVFSGFLGGLKNDVLVDSEYCRLVFHVDSFFLQDDVQIEAVGGEDVHDFREFRVVRTVPVIQVEVPAVAVLHERARFAVG